MLSYQMTSFLSVKLSGKKGKYQSIALPSHVPTEEYTSRVSPRHSEHTQQSVIKSNPTEAGGTE